MVRGWCCRNCNFLTMFLTYFICRHSNRYGINSTDRLILNIFCSLYVISIFLSQMPAYWDAWVKVCRMYNLDFNEKRFYSLAGKRNLNNRVIYTKLSMYIYNIMICLGVPVRDIFELLVSEATHLEVKPDIDELCRVKKSISSSAASEIGIPKIDIVVNIAKAYHGKIPLAVASSGFKSHVLASLKENNILELFDAIITAEDVTNPKPAPDIFLLAAQKINCDPKKCRGFEDADLGMTALYAAGIQAIDVRKIPGYPHAKASDRSVLLDIPNTTTSDSSN